MGLEFTVEELQSNTQLRERLIGMVQIERPDIIDEINQQRVDEATEEAEARARAEQEKARNEVVEEANLFIYHISSEASAT